MRIIKGLYRWCDGSRFATKRTRFQIHFRKWQIRLDFDRTVKIEP